MKKLFIELGANLYFACSSICFPDNQEEDSVVDRKNSVVARTVMVRIGHWVR